MTDTVDLPFAVVSRIVKEVLPHVTIVGKESISMFADAASVFVLFLTDTANSICRNSNRKTVFAQDVLDAVQDAQFEIFSSQLVQALEEHRAIAKQTDGKEAEILEDSEKAMDADSEEVLCENVGEILQ